MPDTDGGLRNNLLKIHLPLFLVQGMFSIIPVFSKLAFVSFPPETIVFFRIVVSGFLFFVIYLAFFKEKIEKKIDYFHFAILGVFGVVINQLLFIKGVSLSKAINASLLITTIPVFTLILAALKKQEKITPLKLSGLFTAFIGVWVLLGFGNLRLFRYLTGNLLILLNSLSFSLYLVLSKPVLKRYKPFTVITWVFVFGAFEMALLGLLGIIKTEFYNISAGPVAALSAIVLFSTFFTYLINALVLKKITASLVAMYTYLQPLAGSVLAVIIIGEKISLSFVYAALLILSGVTLVSMKQSN